mmetsp:Transcript_3022/g.6057  ORF Transcript_3022/g.6057 Transcript_3022/m.6057 type:complete len:132 (+) Transcript_3022:14-409(+)
MSASGTEKLAGSSKEGPDEAENENKSSNWGDNVIGAAALTNRRLLHCLTISDSERFLVYGDARRLLVADCGSGELVACDQPHSDRVVALGFHPEKKIVVTSGQNDKKLVVWELPGMNIVSQVRGSIATPFR